MSSSGAQNNPPIHRHRILDSTNSEAFRIAESGAPHLTAVAAEFQTAGRGQPGHEWWMPESEGILLSILLREIPSGILFQDLTLRAGWTAARLLEEKTGVKIEIKLPNDLMINGKKAGGILCEARWRDDELRCAVIGIGINVNVRHFPEELRAIATSLAIEAGREFDREELLQALVGTLREMIGLPSSV
ncbi:biotin--[acetyl-CoA-carboxylase] ligase [Candidatus Sumerlaeota bacterium]|nr:biotin--[acetyl-CoA-carboxylase] ligase [Candidatus Sumerlaeota bacterium]